MERLNLPYWSEGKYMQLLVPSLFTLSVKNINDVIEVLKKYKIDDYVTNKCLRMKISLLEKLIEHLIQNDIDLLVYNE